MKKKCAKTLKRGATKKGKTGTTRKARSRTRSKEDTSQTSYYATVESLNSRGTSITHHKERCGLYATLTPASTFDFSLRKITQFGKEERIDARRGPKGLDILTPSGEVFQTIGWFEEIESGDDYWSQYE